MLEINPFLLSAAAQHEEGHNGQKNSNPLEPVESLTEDQHRSDKHENRTSGVDRADDRQREMLHSVIAQCPGTEDNDALQQNPFLDSPTAIFTDLENAAAKGIGAIGQSDEWNEYEGAEQRVQEQHGDDGIAAKGFLFARVVESEQDRRQER